MTKTAGTLNAKLRMLTRYRRPWPITIHHHSKRANRFNVGRNGQNQVTSTTSTAAAADSTNGKAFKTAPNNSTNEKASKTAPNNSTNGKAHEIEDVTPKPNQENQKRNYGCFMQKNSKTKVASSSKVYRRRISVF